MKQVDIWQWTMRSQTTGQVARSRWKMTEAEAKTLDPMAQRVEGSREVLAVYEDADPMLPANSAGLGNACTPPEGHTKAG